MEKDEQVAKLAAGIFGLAFKELAREATAECKEVARQLWAQRFQYGFADAAMGADGALAKLGLARPTGDGKSVEYL
jgi:hypothetical protein